MNLSLPGKAHHAGAIAGWCRALADKVEKTFSQVGHTVILGGDHSLSIGSVAGALRWAKAIDRPLHVLWLDAHADYNTPETSLTGNMHGMAAAFFCGEPSLETLVECPKLPPEHFHLLGVRSIDPEERALLAARGVDVCDMPMIDEEGIAPLIRRILQKVKDDNAMLHVSLDIDFLDPDSAPGVGTTVPGGTTFREAHLVMEMIHRSGLLCSLDLVELNPFLDERGKSARLMVDLAASAFGRRVFDRPTQPA